MPRFRCRFGRTLGDAFPLPTPDPSGGPIVAMGAIGESGPMSKITTPAEAVALIPSGATLGVDGFVGSVCPEELLLALEARFLETGEPRGLTVLASTGSGDTRGRGLDRLRHDGLVGRLMTSYLNLNRALQRRLIENEIEGYLLPLGVMVQLYREIAAGRPGLITHVGLDTFVDPEHGGGKVNARTTEDYVERIRLRDRNWLFYPSIRLDAGILRATTADPDGNLTMEREIGTFQGPSFAQAVRNSGGVVIAQVERIAGRGSLDPRRVVVPGHLVDRVVVAEPGNHPQTFAVQYDPVFSGEIRADMDARPPRPLSVKKLIGRRAAMELRRGDVVNLGVGAPEYVATVAGEEGCGDAFTLTVESGATGGYPAYGLSFGAAANPTSVIDNTYQFDFYDGGGLDITFVGMAQLDAAGNVNVSRLSTRIPGIGGFFNVTQGARRVVFCGQFTAGESDIRVGGGRLDIVSDGRPVKFVETVEQVSFNASAGIARGQSVMAVTERCVFRIGPDGPVLTEVAPGVDPERDILARMAFRPRIADDLRQMPEELFRDGPFGLAGRLA